MSPGASPQENISCLLVTIADSDVNDQFGNRIKCNVGPRVAPSWIMFGTLASLLATHKLPHFVGLNFSCRNIPYFFGHDSFGFFARKDQQFQDCILVNLGES